MDDKPLPFGWVIALRVFFGGLLAVPGLLLIGSAKIRVSFANSFRSARLKFAFSGLRSKGWKKYYWLNIQKLATPFLRSQQTLIATKYFTTNE